VTVAAAWAIWQPLRASDADGAAISALTRRDAGTALADARTATDAEPFALAPLQELSSIYAALHRPQLAQDELVKATTVQPENPLSWKLLGQYALGAGHPRLALRAFTRAAQLDLTDTSLAPSIAQARAAIGARP
jgi:Tfp pilus assembly protein PilF